MRQAWTTLESHAVPLREDNVDTDQIIPAAYLTTVSREGLGEGLFHAWRYTPEGARNESFVLSNPAYAGAKILLAGQNFGSGSSREHAVWALMDYGFRAVIAPAFADIFAGNSLNNGLLVIRLAEDEVAALFQQSEADPKATIAVDLKSQTVQASDGTIYTFPIDPFRKECLLKGLDDLGYLLQRAPRISAFEERAAQALQPSTR